jgi:hypothetical protein
MSTLQESTTAVANEYTFTHDEGTTLIVFYPNRPGPILQGEPETGPELRYKGVEGTFTFFSDRIEIQDSPLGSLISVLLKPNVGAGGLTFTLVLPPVNMGAKKKETFYTLGIKTTSIGNIIAEGAQRTYTVLHLKGLAEIAILPL